MKKELIQLLKGKNAYIQTHDFPDPDALATAFALQEYLKYYEIEATICSISALVAKCSENALALPAATAI